MALQFCIRCRFPLFCLLHVKDECHFDRKRLTFCSEASSLSGDIGQLIASESAIFLVD